MTADPRLEAEAGRLLALLPNKEPPVDVKAIAELLGIAIEPADLGDEVSGVLVREGNQAVIGVNWSHHPNRQRFTIAHEIAHHRLHKGGTYIDKGVTARFRNQQSGSGTEGEEREANGLAAALLMPKHWIERAFRSQPFDLADEDKFRAFADRFEVSVQAMAIRIKDLELARP